MSIATTGDARPPRPPERRRPRPTVELGGTVFQVGVDAFLSEQAALAASGDGTVHSMLTSSGLRYYMPGSSHEQRELAERPIALDGYYPLYSTEGAARAASLREGGSGQVSAVGPLTTAAEPVRWSKRPYTQTYYMPSDGAIIYSGDYVFPSVIDGYFPLYSNVQDARKASKNGQAQSHGPGSETGHPLAWSVGRYQIFYMPATGPKKYYGNYTEAGDPKSEFYFSADLWPAVPAGEGPAQAAAAAAIAASSD